MDADLTAQLTDRIRDAAARGAGLSLVGGGSKQFLGREVSGDPLDLAAHCGILEYDPGELVLRARAGTPLTEIETALARHGQYLAFEPPHFGVGATLGGTVACGIAGPARPYRGAVKDFVLGVGLLSGSGEGLRFGGQVMKNVAGFDVSRLMVGSFGCLAPILEVSLKVLPRPPGSCTLQLELDSQTALIMLAQVAQKPNCVSASCWTQGCLSVRLSGSPAAIAATRRELGGNPLEEGAATAFWRDAREQRHSAFADCEELLRIVVPATTPAATLPQVGIWEWGGSQRWAGGDSAYEAVSAAAAAVGGFVTRFRSTQRAGELLAPPPAAQLALLRRLKAVFDPAGLFNRGRLYAAL